MAALDASPKSVQMGVFALNSRELTVTFCRCRDTVSAQVLRCCYAVSGRNPQRNNCLRCYKLARRPKQASLFSSNTEGADRTWNAVAAIFKFGPVSLTHIWYHKARTTF